MEGRTAGRTKPGAEGSGHSGAGTTAGACVCVCVLQVCTPAPRRTAVGTLPAGSGAGGEGVQSGPGMGRCCGAQAPCGEGQPPTLRGSKGNGSQGNNNKKKPQPSE